MRRRTGLVLLAAFVILGLAGCAPEALTAEPSPSSTPRASDSASPSPLPSASPSLSPSPEPQPSLSPDPAPSLEPALDIAKFSIDNSASLWVVSNKRRPLAPIGFVPPDLVTTPVATQNAANLRAVAADAIVQMFAAGAAEGAGGMQLQSAYRSYDTQVSVYNGYVAREGQASADAQSARPGHSEHQTGLAADISADPLECVLAACFGQTTQGAWLAENAWRFGFILRYPDGMTPITGFIYEPWHFRYVGTELSTEMHETGIATLEEFFGLPAAPDYSG